MTDLTNPVTQIVNREILLAEIQGRLFCNKCRRCLHFEKTVAVRCTETESSRVRYTILWCADCWEAIKGNLPLGERLASLRARQAIKAVVLDGRTISPEPPTENTYE